MLSLSQKKEEADKVASDCKERMCQVEKEDVQTKTVRAPKLYDLTSLQRDANRIFGYTAQQTLDSVQEMYEKKLVTYPRTDSQMRWGTVRNSYSVAVIQDAFCGGDCV